MESGGKQAIGQRLIHPSSSCPHWNSFKFTQITFMRLYFFVSLYQRKKNTCFMVSKVLQRDIKPLFTEILTGLTCLVASSGSEVNILEVRQTLCVRCGRMSFCVVCYQIKLLVTCPINRSFCLVSHLTYRCQPLSGRGYNELTQSPAGINRLMNK